MSLLIKAYEILPALKIKEKLKNCFYLPFSIGVVNGQTSSKFTILLVSYPQTIYILSNFTEDYAMILVVLVANNISSKQPPLCIID